MKHSSFYITCFPLKISLQLQKLPEDKAFYNGFSLFILSWSSTTQMSCVNSSDAWFRKSLVPIPPLWNSWWHVMNIHDMSWHVMIKHGGLSWKIPKYHQISPKIFICHEMSPCFWNIFDDIWDHHCQSEEMLGQRGEKSKLVTTIWHFGLEPRDTFLACRSKAQTRLQFSP